MEHRPSPGSLSALCARLEGQNGEQSRSRLRRQMRCVTRKDLSTIRPGISSRRSAARGGRGCATNLTSCATKARDGLSAFGCLHPLCPSGHSLPQLPGLIRLPDPLPTFDLQGGQPAPAVAEGVDALEVAQVQKLPVLLRRVADDCDLAGTVALGEPPSSSRLSPPLLYHRAAGQPVGGPRRGSSLGTSG